MNCPICSWTPDNRDYLLLSETLHWRICLAPNQSLLGTCVIPLKRHAGSLANLNEHELLEFLNVVKLVEEAVRLSFSATMFNWSCYMNHSYRESPPHPHVHWWAVPRYDKKVEFDSFTFEDPYFGNPYDHFRVMNLPNEAKFKIAEEIKRHLLYPNEKSL